MKLLKGKMPKNKKIKKKDFSEEISELKTVIIHELNKCSEETREVIKESETSITTKIFMECSKIRKEIGYQNILIKLIEDNLDNIHLKEEKDNGGLSSKIEISVGADLFGTGIKWVLDIDVSKVNYKELKESIENMDIISENKRQKLLKLLKEKI